MIKIVLALIFFFPALSFAANYEVTTPGNNVGFGTSTPTQAIDVVGAVKAEVYHTPNPIGGVTCQNGCVIDPTGGGNAVVIAPTDNVGIGTYAPGALLDVGGTARVTGFNMPTGAVNGYTLIEDSFGNFTAQAPTSQFTNVTGGINYGGGNVGIGSATPVQALDVIGKIRTSSGFIGDGTGITGLSGSISGLTTNDIIKASSATAIQNTISMNENSSGNVGIGTTLQGGKFVVMQGNVGIGTWIPSNTLAVAGGLSASTGSFAGNVTLTTGQVSTASGAIFVSQSGIQSQAGVNGSNFVSANNSDTTGNIYSGSSSGLTSGTIYNATSTSGAFTGNLLNLNFTGTGSGNGGNIGIGTLGTGAGLKITDLGSGPAIMVASGNVGIGTTTNIDSSVKLGGTCQAIGPVGACWTASGQMGYCSGAAGVCTTCTKC